MSSERDIERTKLTFVIVNIREEARELPKFEVAISEEESKKLAASFERTKNFVPTRFVPSLVHS